MYPSVSQLRAFKLPTYFVIKVLLRRRYDARWIKFINQS